MTVQELIQKLSELPEELRSIPVHLETEEGGGALSEVRAVTGTEKIWWQPDHIVLSCRY